MEHEQARTFLVHSAHDIGIDLTETQIAQFMCYLTQLSHWNRTINLTSIVEPQEIMIKHFIDSLMALTVLDFPRAAVLIDVGTGAGFPGVPLKIVRDDLRVTLIERIKKKCSFLTSIAGVLRLENLQVFQGTLLQYDEKADRQIADIVTVRAVNFRDICDSVVRILSPKGRVVLYRTERIEGVDLDRRFRVESEKNFFLPKDSGKRVISVLNSFSV